MIVFMGPSRDVKFQLLPVPNLKDRPSPERIYQICGLARKYESQIGAHFAYNRSTASALRQLDTLSGMEAKFFSAVMILITLLFADGDEGK